MIQYKIRLDLLTNFARGCMNNRQYAELSAIIADTYSEIKIIEEKGLRRLGRGKLSIVEFHLLECINRGRSGMRTMGEIAEAMAVTLPTVTVAVNRLERKGYVTKERLDDDRRVIMVTLTDDGRRMDRLHTYFHEQMVFSIREEFTGEEMEYIYRLAGRLNLFFREKNGKTSNMKNAKRIREV